MSQTSRQRLLSDAEKLNASRQLWAGYCERVAYVLSYRHIQVFLCDRNSEGESQGMFAEAVAGYMTDRGEGHHEDVLRAFFRLQVCIPFQVNCPSQIYYPLDT